MTLALDPAERAHRRKRRREVYAQAYQGMGWKTSSLPDAVPPDEVIADRDRRAQLPEPLLGDPRSGYSAADRPRNGHYSLSGGAMKRHTATLSPPIGRSSGEAGVGWVYVTLPRITILLDGDAGRLSGAGGKREDAGRHMDDTQPIHGDHPRRFA